MKVESAKVSLGRDLQQSRDNRRNEPLFKGADQPLNLTLEP